MDKFLDDLLALLRMCAQRRSDMKFYRQGQKDAEERRKRNSEPTDDRK